MKRRSLMEIYIAILRAVAKGRRKPTHIMYRANLTWTRLNKHLDVLVDKGLLTEGENDGHAIFMLTSRGSEVLGYYTEIRRELYDTKKVTPSERIAQKHWLIPVQDALSR
ncbi:MAG: winged helix-turn-helix domain-containing protein, partial [Candidatus Bathyarchaeota archaeon]|nr:winged helix-turn-helix domain-containing protein [Candidatus Bathyarchaeota archaeon]